MKCVVCKETREEKSNQRWFFTSERSPTSHISLLFKFYEFTRQEVTPGTICPTCQQLVAHIDSLEYQVCRISLYLQTLSAQDRLVQKIQLTNLSFYR